VKRTYKRSYSKWPYWPCKLFNYALNDYGYLMSISYLLFHNLGGHIKGAEMGELNGLSNASKLLVTMFQREIRLGIS
jgi:hypothetical protein